MNAPEHNPAASELLRHAQWIRSLARALVSDDAAAEDVVQETMVAALTHPPTQSKLRPWLGQVVRNFARLHHRSSGRRREHEGGARGPDDLPGPEELSERLEAEQQLTRELARLDEPFRSTLMHRYYDDLAPAEIASRLGVPGGTVRWRLKRGLEILRSRLDDAHHGDRRAWSLALLPLARIENAAAIGAVATSVAIPGLILMNAIKVVGAAAAVCLITVSLAVTGVLPESFVPWSRADAPVPVSFRPIETEVVAVSAPTLLEPEPVAERVAATVAPTPEPEPEVAAAVPIEKDLVFDAHILGDGVALAGAQMLITTAGSGLEDSEPIAPGISRADGTVTASLPGWAEPWPATIEFHAAGFASIELEARGKPGLTTHLGQIDLAPGGVISGVVLDENGRGLPDCTVTLADAETSARQLAQLRYMPAHIQVPSTRTDELGRFRLVGVPLGMLRLWGHAEDYLSGFTAPIEVRDGQESFGVEFELEPLGAANLVRGIVLAPDGTPIPEASLQFRNTSEVTHTTVAGSREADEDGRFEFLLREDAQLDLTASDPEGRWGKATVAGISPGNLELELRLREEVMLAVEARSANGDLVTHFGLEIVEQGGQHQLAHVPAADHPEGRAEFAQPTTAFLVRITAAGHALLELGPLHPESVTQADLMAMLQPLPGLRGQVLRDGEPVAGIKVFLHPRVEGDEFRVRNGFRLRMQGYPADETRTDDEGQFLMTPRSSGGYFVRARPSSGAPSEFGPFEVARDLSGPDVELHLGVGGSIEGRVELAGGRSPEGAIVGLTRGDGRARTRRVGPDGSYRFDDLMAGPWRLELREEELTPGHTSTTSSDSGGDQPFDPWSCTVFDGETTYFDLREVPTDHFTFTARLTVNGEQAEGWMASFAARIPEDIEGGPQVAMNRMGEFELRATSPGRQFLVLRHSLGEHGEQLLIDEVDVGDGRWERNLKTGSLTLQGLDAWAKEGIPRLAHYWNGPGDLYCLTLAMPDEHGELHLDGIPAGESRFVEPSRPFDPEQWRVIREVQLEPGDQQTITLP